MARTVRSGRGAILLADFPNEILLDIYRDLDITSIFELSLTNRFFHDLLTHRRVSILLPVMIREFSPFDELVQVYTASADDLLCTHGGSMYQPRSVIFKRFNGDAGLDLTPASALSTDSLSFSHHDDLNVGAGFTPVAKGGKTHQFSSSSASSSLRAKVLTSADLTSLLQHCQLVRKWEDLFPSMRWFYDPEKCRTLRPHEQARFRRALYRWWLYGIYFHGDLPRPRVGLPEPRVDDVRTSQMRRHPTSELLELMDLVETMKDVVLHYICPRLDPEQQQQWNCTDAAVSTDQPALIDSVDRAQSLTDSWMDQSRWSRIVKTYAKLGPRELMYYFENIYSYPAERLVREIRARHPNFTSDQESIQVAVRCALDERDWLSSSSQAVPSLAEDGRGGIVDFDDQRDGERALFGGDACGDGGLPDGMQFVRSFSQWSPRGDDGASLGEEQWGGSGSGSGRMRRGLMGWA